MSHFQVSAGRFHKPTSRYRYTLRNDGVIVKRSSTLDKITEYVLEVGNDSDTYQMNNMAYPITVQQLRKDLQREFAS